MINLRNNVKVFQDQHSQTTIIAPEGYFTIKGRWGTGRKVQTLVTSTQDKIRLYNCPYISGLPQLHPGRIEHPHFDGYLSFQTTIRGIPATILYTVSPAEPEAGYPYDSIDEILFFSDKGYRSAFLEARAETEMERIEHECWENFRKLKRGDI